MRVRCASAAINSMDDIDVDVITLAKTGGDELSIEYKERHSKCGAPINTTNTANITTSTIRNERLMHIRTIVSR